MGRGLRALRADPLHHAARREPRMAEFGDLCLLPRPFRSRAAALRQRRSLHGRDQGSRAALPRRYAQRQYPSVGNPFQPPLVQRGQVCRDVARGGKRRAGIEARRRRDHPDASGRQDSGRQRHERGRPRAVRLCALHLVARRFPRLPSQDAR